MEGITAKWLNAFGKITAFIGGALYNDLRNSIDNGAKALPNILGVLVIIFFVFTAGILCVYEYLKEFEEQTKNFNLEVINELAKKERMTAIEIFERYRTLEEKSFSHEPNKIDIENKYKVGWELFSAIDFITFKKNLKSQNSIDILKTNFTYKEAMVIKNISVKKKTVNGEETKDNIEIKQPAVVEKVLLPIEIDTFYKKMVYEYETKTLISNAEEGNNIITTVIQKEVIKDGFPIEFENVSSRFIPYLNSLGIEGKKDINLLIVTAKKQIQSSNEAFDYISRYMEEKLVE